MYVVEEIIYTCEIKFRRVGTYVMGIIYKCEIKFIEGWEIKFIEAMEGVESILNLLRVLYI